MYFFFLRSFFFAVNLFGSKSFEFDCEHYHIGKLHLRTSFQLLRISNCQKHNLYYFKFLYLVIFLNFFNYVLVKVRIISAALYLSGNPLGTSKNKNLKKKIIQKILFKKMNTKKSIHLSFSIFFYFFFLFE